MTTFKIEFYLASNLKQSVGKPFSMTFSNHDVTGLGDLYSEHLVLDLGQHFTLYTHDKTSNDWTIHNSTENFFIRLPYIHKQIKKTRLPGISGSIGEALIVPALSTAMMITQSQLVFHRITSKRKCPDFRIECNQKLLDLWNITYNSSCPYDLPLEVKTILKKDVGYPREALEQLISYWEICEIEKYFDAVGFGIIARINITESDNCIRFILFVPNKHFDIVKLKSIVEASKASKKGNIIEEVGVLFN